MRRRSAREWLFLGYVLLVPVMINNPSAPLWKGTFGGRIQLSDVLFLPLAVSCMGLVGRLKALPGLRWALAGLSCYIMSCVVSAIIGHTPSGWADAAAGVYLAVVFLITVLVANEPRMFMAALAAWGAGLALVVVGGVLGLVLLGAFGVENPFAHFNRMSPYVGTALKVTSTLKPTSNTLTAYLTVSIGPLLGMYYSRLGSPRIRPWLPWLAGACGGLALFTFSRGIFGAFFGLGAMLVLQGLAPGRVRRWAGWILVAVLTGLFILIQGISVYRPIEVTNSVLSLPSPVVLKADVFPNPDGTIQRRTIVTVYGYDAYGWLKCSAWRTFIRHPWLGVGLEQFQEGTRVLVAEGRIPQGIDRYASSQSTLFTLLAEQGVFGASAFVVFWLAVGCGCWRRIHHRLGASGASVMCLGFFVSWLALSLDSLHLDLQKFRFVWVFLGLAWLVSQQAFRGQQHA